MNFKLIIKFSVIFFQYKFKESYSCHSKAANQLVMKSLLCTLNKICGRNMNLSIGNQVLNNSLFNFYKFYDIYILVTEQSSNELMTQFYTYSI